MLKLWLATILIIHPTGKFELRHAIPTQPIANTEQACRDAGAAQIQSLMAVKGMRWEDFRMSCQEIFIPVDHLEGKQPA
jgi:hypothetical protein